MLEIYQIAVRHRPRLSLAEMTDRGSKKEESEKRARILYARLLRLKPRDLSERQWTIKAGVSSSFFTNLRDKAAEPSVGNLRAVLEAVGSSLPEFFAAESGGRLYAVPSEQELETVFDAVLPGLPAERDRQAAYLASSVAGVLGLHPSVRANKSSAATPDSGAHEANAQSR